MTRPEDIALRNRFEASDDIGKQNIFREIFRYTVEDIRDESFLRMNHDNVISNLNSLLSVLSSADRTSPEIMQMIDRYTATLLEMQDNNTYSPQIEYINILLNFLHPHQFFINSDNKMLHFKDGDNPAAMDIILITPHDDNNTSPTSLSDKSKYTPEIPVVGLNLNNLAPKISLSDSGE